MSHPVRALSTATTCVQVHEATIAAGAYPSPLNYYSFPKSLCTSVNEVGEACRKQACQRPAVTSGLYLMYLVCFHALAGTSSGSSSTLSFRRPGQLWCMSQLTTEADGAVQVICHGIPDKRPLENGDIVNVDVSVFYKGYHGDLNETYLVGDCDDESKRLVQTTAQVDPQPRHAR